MNEQKIYVGDTGTAIELDTEADLTGAAVAILAQKPDGTSVEWTAVPTGAIVRYLTLADDLDQAGTWKLQAEVSTGAGKWLGATVKLKVYEEFK